MMGAVDELLERSAQLATLSEALTAVRATSAGRMLLVGGEAGVGKTMLLRDFCGRQDDRLRILWGACDGLLTPGPLDPLFDIAESTGGELEALVSREARPHEVAGALIRELDGGRVTIVVIDDLHWADEATLDVLRLLARKIGSVPALVLATYRDTELDRAHPLRIVVGELATNRAVARVAVPPLSSAAVAQLAAPFGVDAEVLYRKTSGNPFFVSEVLAAGTPDVPSTVRDAVLARMARLSPPGQRLLEAIAIAPAHAELWLLERIAAAELDQLEECLASGMVTAGAAAVSLPPRARPPDNRGDTTARSSPRAPPPGDASAGRPARPGTRPRACGPSRRGGAKPRGRAAVRAGRRRQSELSGSPSRGGGSVRACPVLCRRHPGESTGRVARTPGP